MMEDSPKIEDYEAAEKDAGASWFTLTVRQRRARAKDAMFARRDRELSEAIKGFRKGVLMPIVGDIELGPQMDTETGSFVGPTDKRFNEQAYQRVQTGDMSDYHFLTACTVAFNERHDCAIIALCIITGESYPKIHEMLRVAGRRRRCGTYNVQTQAVLSQLGYRVTDVTRQYSERSVRAIGPTLPKDKKFMILVSKHISAVVNGKVIDWAEDRGLFVQTVWQITELYEPEPDIIIPRPVPKGRYRARFPAAEVVRQAGQNVLNNFLAEEKRNQAPRNRRWWLKLRAHAMADLDRMGIKRTTASIELGKWQASIGYDMTELR